MSFLLALVVGVFEFAAPLGAGAAMSAGTAVSDPGNGLRLNPALLARVRRLEGQAAGAAPYGLAGVGWAGVAAGAGFGRLAFGGLASRLSIGGYSEVDAGLGVALVPRPGVGVGAAARWLAVAAPGRPSAFAPAFDAGVVWQVGRFELGAAARNLNAPELWPGQAVVPRLGAGVAWTPADALTLAVDVGRAGGDESAAAGAELRLAPALTLRVGAGSGPLRYSAGVRAGTEAVGATYAFQFSPLLGATHVFGVAGCWR